MNIAYQRLYNQRLSETTFKTPEEVVGWLGAVQSQDYAGAKWALGLRLQGVTDADIEQAFTEGSILRTHVMRPTWHFVAPTDIRWLLALTAPRVNALNAYYYRQLELDDALFLHSHDAVANALRGGKQLTRVELGSVLAQIGIDASGMRLGYIVHRAELDGIVCSGARRGKQFTYALLDERVPETRTLSRDEALAELTKRYFTSHGPAMIQDFVWWSGLTTADAKSGLEMSRAHLTQETIDGKIYWFSSSMPVTNRLIPPALLLPPYDEYTIAYKDHSAILDPAYGEQAKTQLYGGAAVSDSQAVGYWRRTFSKGTAVIEIAPFRPLDATERDAFAAAAQHYGEFLGLPAVLT